MAEPTDAVVPSIGEDYNGPVTPFASQEVGEDYNGPVTPFAAAPGTETNAMMGRDLLALPKAQAPVTVESAGSFAEASRQRNAADAARSGSISTSNYDFDTRAAHKDDNALQRGAFKGLVNIQQQTQGLRRFYGEATGDTALTADASTEGARMTRMDTAAGEGSTPFEKNVVGATSSIISQLPGLVGGLATGGSSIIPLTMMGLTTFGQEFENGRAAGKSFEHASERAGLYGIAEVIGEKFGLGSKMKALLGAAKGLEAKEVSAHISKMLLAEIPGEQLTTLMEFLTDKNRTIGLTPQATLEDYLQQVGQTFTQTITQAAMMGGAAHGVRAARGGADAIRGESTQIAEADAEQAKQRAIAKADFGFGRADAAATARQESRIAAADASGVDPLTLEPIAPTGQPPALPGPGTVGTGPQAAQTLPMGEALAPTEVPLQTPGEAHAAAVQKARDAEEARKAALPPHEIEIDPQNPAASVAAILAAPMPEVAPALATPAGLDEKTHADASGFLADSMAQIHGLTLEGKLAPAPARPLIQRRIADLTEQARQHKAAYAAAHGPEAADHMHRVAAETFHSIKGDYRSLMKPTVAAAVQESAKSTEREQPAKVNTEAPARDFTKNPVQRGERVMAPAPESGTIVPVEGSSAAPKVTTDLDRAAHEAAASTTNERGEPTGPQALAGNYKMGHVTFAANGMGVSIENPSGSIREDKHNLPPKWRRRMSGVHYGYWKNTEAADKRADGSPDKLDVMILEGTHRSWNGPVFIVDQVHPKTGKFDEHKTIIGASTEEKARKAYLDQYEKGWKGLGSISKTTMSGFKTWTLTANTTVPYADKVVKAEESTPTTKKGVNATGTVHHQRAMALHSNIERKHPKAAVSDVREHAKLILEAAPNDIVENGRNGYSVPVKGHAVLAGLVKDALRLGMPKSVFAGLSGFHLYRPKGASENARFAHAVNGVRSIGFNESLFDAAMNGDDDALRSLLQVFAHELGHEITTLGRLQKIEVTSTESSSMLSVALAPSGQKTYGPVMQEMVDAYNDVATDPALREFLNYPLQYLGWSKADARNIGGFVSIEASFPYIQDEAFGQLHTLYYTQPALMKATLPQAYNMMKEVQSGLNRHDDDIAAGRQEVRGAIRSTGTNVPVGLRRDVRFGETPDRNAGRKTADRFVGGLSERSRQYLQERKQDQVFRQSRNVQDVADKAAKAFDKRVAKSTTKFGVGYRKREGGAILKNATLQSIAEHFDQLVADEFGGPLDINNPVHVQRAVRMATEEVQHQLQQERTGLDWYSTDISDAFGLTQKYIPELEGATERVLFTAIAALHSPAKPADQNWHNAALAFKDWTVTGKFPETNPNGDRWGPRISPLPFAHLNSMIEDIGPTATVQFLTTMHNGEVLRKAKAKYGVYVVNEKGDSGVENSRIGVPMMGMNMFGPKIGPFMLGLNGFDTEVAVDSWATRSIHRWFGTGMKNGKVIDAPTEPERRAFTAIITKVGEDLGYNPNQMQAVEWFFEQQLYTKMGLASRSSFFSDGAKQLLESEGLNDTAGTEQDGGSRVGNTPDASQGQAEGTAKASQEVGYRDRESAAAEREEASRVSFRAQRSLADEGRNLAGLPASSIGSSAVAQQVAQEYMDGTGMSYSPPTSYVKVDPAYSKRIADAYAEMEHAPNDPNVKAAYRAMIDETVAQWHAMMDTGLTVDFTSSEKQYPYRLPQDAMRDVRDNNHLTVYSTDEGFGNEGDADTSDNPLLAKTDIKVGGKTLLANDVFRAVHDYFGHVKDGVGFRADGEENAWRSHAAMYSDLARKAMTSETRGQNSFVNYGPNGDKNRTAKTEDTVFGEQKAGLLPDEFVRDNYESVDADVSFRQSISMANTAPTFYSGLSRAIDTKAPFGKDGTMPAAQMRAWLTARAKDGLIDGEEMAWSGIDDWLALRADAPALEAARVAKINRELAEDIGQTRDAVKEVEGMIEKYRSAGNDEKVARASKSLVTYRKDLAKLEAQEQATARAATNKVSKADVASFLDQNGVKISETVLGGEADKNGGNPARVRETDEGDWDIENAQTGMSIDGVYDTQEAAQEAADAWWEDERRFGSSEPDAARTQFSSHVLPGGENYRELLLTLPVQSDASPMIVGKPTFQSSHFDTPNILAHVRFNERTDADGNRVLFIEELQSDWAQKGRKEGFAEQGKINTARDYYGVPAAPFIGKTEAWVALSIKRMIRYAIDNGMSAVAWTNGEQQAERYDLSKQVQQITAKRVVTQHGDKYAVKVTANGGAIHDLHIPLTASELVDHVGKDMADKIIKGTADNTGTQVYNGLDLKVGGEGMKSFYDKIVPNVANDVLKRVGGGRVGTVSIQEPGSVRGRSMSDGRGGIINIADNEDLQQPGFTITPEMAANVSGGQPTFKRSVNVNGYGKLTPGQEQARKNVLGEKQSSVQRLMKLKQGIGTRIQQGVVDQFAPIKALDQHAYLLARLSKGSDGALEAILTYGNLSLANGVTDSNAKGIGLIESMRALRGEDQQFMLWVAAHRAEQLTTEDREHLFSSTDIKELKTLNRNSPEFPGREAAYMKVLDDYNRMSRNILDIAEQSGIIDGDSRHLWEKQFYVPFYRALEDDVSTPNISRSPGLIRQYAFKKLKGGKEHLNEDLFANVLMNWSHLLGASAKNRAARAALIAAENAGVATEQPGFGVSGMPIPKEAVWYLEKGQRSYYTVDDPLVMSAITSLEAGIIGGAAGKFLSQMKVALTIGVTANPAFKIRNLMRDSISALAQSDLSLNIAGNIVGGINETRNHKSQVRASMLAGGGMIRFGTMLEGNRSAHVSKLINAGVKDSTILDTKEKFKDAIQVAWDYYNELGDISENANRASLYKQMRAAGKSHAEASLAARDLLDFSKGGSWGAIRFLTQTVPFLNARIQGLARLAEGMAKHPGRFTSIVAATALASIALMLAYDDDDDWKKREDWDRDNYWWFKVGGVAYRIPKPFEVGVLATLAERGLETWTNDEMTAARFRDRIRFAISNTFAMNPSPQLFKPMLDIYANVDSFTGRPIEGRGQEGLPKAERVNSGTSEFAKLVGKVSNLKMDNKALLEISPEQVDHLVRGYFGWLGTMATVASDAAVRPFLDRPPKAAHTLKDFAGSFAEDLPSAQSRYVTQFYDQAKIINETYKSYHERQKVNPADAREYRLENSAKIQAEPRVAEFQRQLSDLNAQQKKIESNMTMDPDTKLTKLNLIASKRNSITERASKITSKALD